MLVIYKRECVRYTTRNEPMQYFVTIVSCVEYETSDMLLKLLLKMEVLFTT